MVKETNYSKNLANCIKNIFCSHYCFLGVMGSHKFYGIMGSVHKFYYHGQPCSTAS